MLFLRESVPAVDGTFVKLWGGPTVGAEAKEKEEGRGEGTVVCLMATVR